MRKLENIIKKKVVVGREKPQYLKIHNVFEQQSDFTTTDQLKLNVSKNYQC